MKIKNYFAKIKDFLVVAYSKNKKLFIISVILILIIIVSGGFMLSNKSKSKVSQKNIDNNSSVTDYASSIETKLENMIMNVKDVSSVDVFVMVESTPIKNYLTETEVVEITNSGGTTTTTTTTVVYEKDGSASTPIEVSTTLPKITGVLIFLNKVNSSTKLSITNAVACVLSIDSSCISILQDR